MEKVYHTLQNKGRYLFICLLNYFCGKYTHSLETLYKTPSPINDRIIVNIYLKITSLFHCKQTINRFKNCL